MKIVNDHWLAKLTIGKYSFEGLGPIEASNQIKLVANQVRAFTLKKLLQDSSVIAPRIYIPLIHPLVINEVDGEDRIEVLFGSFVGRVDRTRGRFGVFGVFGNERFIITGLHDFRTAALEVLVPGNSQNREKGWCALHQGGISDSTQSTLTIALPHSWFFKGTDIPTIIQERLRLCEEAIEEILLKK